MKVLEEVCVNASFKELKEVVVKLLSTHLKPTSEDPVTNMSVVEAASLDDSVTVNLSDIEPPIDEDDGMLLDSSFGSPSDPLVSPQEPSSSGSGSGSGSDTRDYVLVSKSDANALETAMDMDTDIEGGDVDDSQLVEASTTVIGPQEVQCSRPCICTRVHCPRTPPLRPSSFTASQERSLTRRASATCRNTNYWSSSSSIVM